MAEGMADGMASPPWQPGDHLMVRTIWFGHVHSAHPVVVVEDDGQMLVTYLTPGQLWKRPFLESGEQSRVPSRDGPFELRDEEWYGHGALRIFMEGVAHSMLVFLGPEGVDRWYINLEDPPTRTARGIDTRDHMIDLVFNGDLSEYRWKDVDELDEALGLGVITPEDAAAFRAEGERVLGLMLDSSSGGHPAVQERWHTWKPPPEWTAPSLPDGWAEI